MGLAWRGHLRVWDHVATGTLTRGMWAKGRPAQEGWDEAVRNTVLCQWRDQSRSKNFKKEKEQAKFKIHL